MIALQRSFCLNRSYISNILFLLNSFLQKRYIKYKLYFNCAQRSSQIIFHTVVPITGCIRQIRPAYDWNWCSRKRRIKSHRQIRVTFTYVSLLITFKTVSSWAGNSGSCNTRTSYVNIKLHSCVSFWDLTKNTGVPVVSSQVWHTTDDYSSQ